MIDARSAANATRASTFTTTVDPCARAYAFFLLFLFFVPTFAGVLRQGSFYLGAILQVTYTAIFLGAFTILMVRRPAYKTHFSSALFLALAFFLLITLAVARDVQRVVPGDLLELHKPVFAFIIFLTTLLIAWDDAAVHRVANAYIAIVAVMALYSLLEVFGGAPGHAVSTLLYKQAKPVLAGKATGTFGQTYVYGAFMIFGFLYSGALYLYTRRIRYLCVAVLALMAIALSQSRSAAIGFVAMLLCTLATYGFYKNFKHKLVVYTIGIVSIGLLLLVADRVLDVFQHLPYLYGGISRLIAHGVDAGGGGSFNERYQQLLFAIESQDAVPLVGVGIGKGYARLLESYYALYLYRYGGIGMILSVAIFLMLFWHSIKAFNRALEDRQWVNASFFIALHLWMYAFPILALSSAFHDQGKFAVFFYGALGIILSYNYQKQRTSLADGEAHLQSVGTERNRTARGWRGPRL